MFNKGLPCPSDNEEPMTEEQINSHGLLVCIAKPCCLLTVFEATREASANTMNVDREFGNLQHYQSEEFKFI